MYEPSQLNHLWIADLPHDELVALNDEYEMGWMNKRGRRPKPTHPPSPSPPPPPTEVIEFESVAGGGNNFQINNHWGFDWVTHYENHGVIGPDFSGTLRVGHLSMLAHSGRTRLAWMNNLSGEFSRATPFNVSSLMLCPHRHENLTISIKGYNGATLVAQQSELMSANTAETITLLGFANITKVTFEEDFVTTKTAIPGNGTVDAIWITDIGLY